MLGILNKCFKKEKLNIVTTPTHEHFEVSLCKGGHDFWAYRSPQVKDWNIQFAPIPHNYHLLNPNLGENQLPGHIDIDVVLAQNKFGSYQILAPIAHKLGVPLIVWEHTQVHPQWPVQHIQQLKQMRGDFNVFISDYSRRAWGWEENEAIVVEHGINTEVYKPNPKIEKKNYILTTVNQYSRDVRRWCIGWDIYLEATNNLPRLNLGDDHPHSKPAESIEDLVKHHNECGVFLNTSTHSPFPLSLFEAMSCGDIIVSTATCQIPEVIQHGHNGILTNNPKEMRFYLEDILKNRQNYEALGWNARQTILEKFSLDKFVQKWDNLLRRATA